MTLLVEIPKVFLTNSAKLIQIGVHNGLVWREP